MKEELTDLATTGIGSLPRAEEGEILSLAYGTDIPFFPTSPQSFHSEGMLFQGLSGMPGVELKAADLSLDREQWFLGREALQEKISEAINRNTYLDFLPDSTTRYWEKFWHGLDRSVSSWAKVQIVGPLTLALNLRGLENFSGEEKKEFLFQAHELLFAKAMAMHSAIRLKEKSTLIYLDEPCLGIFNAQDPWHRFLFDELLAFQEELQNQGMRVGIHCCGSADFGPLLESSVKVLSFDSELSLGGILSNSVRLRSWLESGGRLSLGVIPTDLPRHWELASQAEALRRSLMGLGSEVLRSCLLTPACGLGMQSLKEAKQVFQALREFQARLRA